jgi:uncharacterized protein YbjT (DUF2867 family)
MSHTAFVAGATGYTGRAVVAVCLAQGIITHAHVRPDSADLPGWQQRFGAMGAHVDTTPWDTQAMAQRLQAVNPTLVFALLGTTRKRAKQENIPKPYETVDCDLTIRLIEACRSVQPPPRLIYLSAMGVRDTSNAYLQARWKVEQHLRQGKLPYTIARPGLIAGDRSEQRPGEQAAHSLTLGATRLLDTVGAHRWADMVRPLTGSQLARALVHLACATHPEPIVQAGSLAALSRE